MTLFKNYLDNEILGLQQDGSGVPDTYIVLDNGGTPVDVSGGLVSLPIALAISPISNPGTDFAIASNVLTMVNAGRYAISLEAFAVLNSAGIQIVSSGLYSDPAGYPGGSGSGNVNVTYVRHFDAGETLTLTGIGGSPGQQIGLVVLIAERLT